MVTDSASIARYLAAVGEATEVPRRSPSHGPPYWKSRVLRRQAPGDDGSDRPGGHEAPLQRKLGKAHFEGLPRHPLTCAKCGGKLEIIAYLHDQVSISRILEHLGLGPPETAKPPPALHEVVRVPVDEEGREIEAP